MVAILSLGGRFFKAKPFRMTLLREGFTECEILLSAAFRMTRGSLGKRFFLPYGRQNDIVFCPPESK